MKGAFDREEGLEYAYLGKIHGDSADNTHCPRCGNLLIEGNGFIILRDNIADGRRIACGFKIWGGFDS